MRDVYQISLWHVNAAWTNQSLENWEKKSVVR